MGFIFYGTLLLVENLNSIFLINNFIKIKKYIQMGFIVYGSDDSPVVPLLIYYPTHCGYVDDPLGPC